jgi:hypothetical protein
VNPFPKEKDMATKKGAKKKAAKKTAKKATKKGTRYPGKKR